MKIKTFIAGLFLVVFSFSVVGQDVKIRIAATSDVHGSLLPYDFEENQSVRSSLSGVNYLVDSIRKIKNSNLVLLENGDLVQGTPLSYFANFEQDKRQNLFARVLNFMKYDAATVGNHDIEAGPAIYNCLVNEFRFPYLGANVINDKTGRPYFKPYTIINRNGIRIAVIGLTTTGVPNWLPEQLWAGLSFQNMTDAAAHWMKIVSVQEKPDVIIGLFHTGFGAVQPDASEAVSENAGRYLAINVPGFDVVVLGHDHRARNEIVKNVSGDEVLVLNPGSAARNLAFAELAIRVEKGVKPMVTAKSGQLIRVPESLTSKRFERRFRNDQAEILKFANQPVGIIEQPMYAVDALFGNSAITDLIHKVQMEITGAEISFAAPLSTTADIDAGQLYVRDLFKIYRYENFLYTMALSGTEVQQYLEYSYGLWLNQMTSADDNLLLFRNGNTARPALLNPSFNFDSAGGIRYTVDVTKPPGSRVNITGMEDGSPFYLAKTYMVAINSYRGSGGGGHLTSGAGIATDKLRERIKATTPTDFRSYLMNYIKLKKVINPQPGSNWQIVPAQFLEKGKEKERKIFGE